MYFPSIHATQGRGGVFHTQTDNDREKRKRINRLFDSRDRAVNRSTALYNEQIDSMLKIANRIEKPDIEERTKDINQSIVRLKRKQEGKDPSGEGEQTHAPPMISPKLVTTTTPVQPLSKPREISLPYRLDKSPQVKLGLSYESPEQTIRHADTAKSTSNRRNRESLLLQLVDYATSKSPKGKSQGQAQTPFMLGKNSPKSPRSPPKTAAEKSSLAELFKKFQGQRTATFSVKENTLRRDTLLFNDFLSTLYSSLPRSPVNVSRLEDMIIFTLDELNRIIRQERKEIGDTLGIVKEMFITYKENKGVALVARVEALKEEISTLKSNQNKDTPASSTSPIDIPVSVNNSQGVVDRLTALTIEVSTLKGNIEGLNKSMLAKEIKHIAQLSKMQDKLTKLKLREKDLTLKLEQQCETTDRLIQRLLTTVKGGTINSDLRKTELPMEEQTPHHSSSKSNSVEPEPEEDFIPTIPGDNQAHNDMQPVVHMDKFDYSIIYARRHLDKKCHSQRKIPKLYYPASSTHKYYQSLVMTNKASTDTKGLIKYCDQGTQTLLSFCNKKFDSFLLNQAEVESLYKRYNFECQVSKSVSNPRFMCFLQDPIMRLLINLTPTPSPTYDKVPLDKIGLVSQLKQYEQDCYLHSEHYSHLVKAFDGQGMCVEEIDEYMSQGLQVPIPVTDATIKYVFFSYLFSLKTARNLEESIHLKESQIEVLFDICRKLKQKINEYDLLVKKGRADLQNFQLAHKGCSLGFMTTDFIKEKPLSNLPINNITSLHAMANRLKRLKFSLQLNKKKYYSFKIVYLKIYQFFQSRLTETTFDADKLIVKHPNTLEEHFFKLLTDKDTGSRKIEEKMKNFIVTLYNIEDNPKIEIFKRFLNLSNDFPYTRTDEYYYLRALDYMRQECRGLEIPVDTHKGIHLIPFDKMENFINKYIINRLHPRNQANLIKELKELNQLNVEGAPKKRVIDIDSAMIVVLKWLTSKSEFQFTREYCCLLYLVIDLDQSGVLEYREFVSAYQMFNLDTYGEATRLLLKVNDTKIKAPLSLEDSLFLTNMPEPDKPVIEKNWYQEGYIYSEHELKSIFCKYVEEPLVEGKEPYLQLEFNQFFAMINEFQNIFDFPRIYAFLRFDETQVDHEFSLAAETFKNNIEIYLKFINDCKIKDNPWKENFRRRVEELNRLLSGGISSEEKVVSQGLLGHQAEGVSQENISKAARLRVLLRLKLFLLDYLKEDFMQRLDYTHAQELPFS